MVWLVLIWEGVADPVREAQRARDFAGELAACEAVLDSGIRDRTWARCARRIPWLTARKDTDGSFSGLTALDRVRQQYTTQPRESAIAQVSAIFDAPRTAATVRLEAGLWLAREHLDVQGDAEAALSITAPLWIEYPEDRALADLHARSLATLGRTDEARAVEEAAHPIRSAEPQEGLPLLLRQQRRERLHHISLAVVAAYLIVSLPLALQGRQRIRLAGLYPLLGIIGAFALLAGLREPAVLPTFAWIGLALGLIHLLTSGASAAAAPRLRLILGILAGLASLAAGYLSLHQTHQLGSIGL